MTGSTFWLLLLFCAAVIIVVFVASGHWDDEGVGGAAVEAAAVGGIFFVEQIKRWCWRLSVASVLIIPDSAENERGSAVALPQCLVFPLVQFLDNMQFIELELGCRIRVDGCLGFGELHDHLFVVLVLVVSALTMRLSWNLCAGRLHHRADVRDERVEAAGGGWLRGTCSESRFQVAKLIPKSC